MIKYAVTGFLAAAFLTFAAADPQVEAGATPESDAPDIGLLVAAEGAEETYAYCTACHSERIVIQQGLTRAGWEEVLKWMVEEQGLGPIDEPDLSKVLS